MNNDIIFDAVEKCTIIPPKARYKFSTNSVYPIYMTQAYPTDFNKNNTCIIKIFDPNSHLLANVDKNKGCFVSGDLEICDSKGEKLGSLRSNDNIALEDFFNIRYMDKTYADNLSYNIIDKI